MIGPLSPNEYYSPLGRGPILGQLYEIGQFFWAPALYLFGEQGRSPYVVRTEYSQPGRDPAYRVSPMQPSGEFSLPQDHDPTLGTRSDERAVIIRAKRRPVILISTPVSPWADSRRRHDDSFLIAPVYSFAGDETKQTYSPTFIERVKGYFYWQLFYLPGDPSVGIREGFVRLDRIQAIHKTLLEHMAVRLSDDAQPLLHSWIRVYLGETLSEVDDLLFEYREEAIAKLTGQGRP